MNVIATNKWFIVAKAGNHDKTASFPDISSRYRLRLSEYRSWKNRTQPLSPSPRFEIGRRRA
jgi:hypothetical protein